MGPVIFYVLTAVLILFYGYQIVKQLIDWDDDWGFLVLMLIGLGLSAAAIIIMLKSDGTSFIPSILLGINGFLGIWAMNSRS